MTVEVDGAPRAEATNAIDWEAARAFAGENTRLRVGDLLLSAPAAVVEMEPGTAVTIDVEGHGTLAFATTSSARQEGRLA